MAISIRYYLFPEEGPTLRVATKLAQALQEGTSFLPDFANATHRVLQVVLDNDRGKPTTILRYYAMYWSFDEDGGIRGGIMESVADIMDERSRPDPKATGGNVVALGPKINAKKAGAKLRWEPTPADITLVTADIWGTNEEPLEYVTGSTTRRPQRLPWDAREALTKATKPFWEIEYALRDLKLKDLEALGSECRRLAKEGESPELHGALALLAERRLEILRRRRSGKGTWYGFVEVLRWENEHTASTAFTAHERCEGKAAAVKAARRLLVEHADKFSDTVTVEAGIETDLEWEQAARMSREG